MKIVNKFSGNLTPIVCFLLILIFSQCTSKYNDAIEQVLDDVSSKQADDLAAVLEYYTSPSDSLKRKSAYFLVENFPEDKYQTIDKQLLTENIELAFQVWKKPWAKQLTFDEFKELVLPFDLERDSTGTFWRKRFMGEYAFIEDSLKKYPNQNPAVVACTIIHHIFKKKYVVKLIQGQGIVISLSEWDRKKQGDCAAMTYLTNHVMHAIGVPTAVEFTPQWANDYASHYWNVVYVNHHYISFMSGDAPPQSYKVEHYDDDIKTYARKRTKVFRLLYAFNPNSLAALSQRDIPAKFQDSHVIDVSKTSIPTQHVTVKVPTSQSDPFVYLSVFNRGKVGWVAVAWAENKDNQAFFTDVRPEVVYAPSSYQQDSIITFDYPFILKKTGQKHILKPYLNSREVIICYKKYLWETTNWVKIGDTYQLFFWDKNGWVSLGTQIATQQNVVFKNVPKNALLVLRDLTRGKQERIFTYENNKQVFW